MKQIAIIVTLLIAGTFCYGQNRNLQAKYAVRLSNLSTFDKQDKTINSYGTYSTVKIQKENQILHPNIAFRVKNKKSNMHEFELTQFELASQKTTVMNAYPNGQTYPLAGHKLIQTNIAFRYEYIRNFAKKQNSKWMPALGFAGMPYYQRTSLSPTLSTDFGSTNTKIGVRTYLVPRINYAINSRFYADVNIPVCITDTYYEQNNNNTPGNAKQTNNTEFNSLPKFYSLRIGLGLNI
jgi:hypothetical protein